MGNECWIDNLVKFINSIDDVMGLVGSIASIIGLVISVSLLVIALRFKKNIIDRNEKHAFLQEREELYNRFMGEFKTYSGKSSMYKPLRLSETRLRIHEITVKYTFFSKELKGKLNTTYDLIINTCYPEAEQGKSDHRMQLCEEINSVANLIKKEEIF